MVTEQQQQAAAAAAAARDGSNGRSKIDSSNQTRNSQGTFSVRFT